MTVASRPFLVGVLCASWLLACRLPYADRDDGDPVSRLSGGGSASRGLGDRCTAHGDCASNACLEISGDGLPPFCSRACDGRDPCPEGMSCRGTSLGAQMCGFDNAPAPLEVGGQCRFDLQCVSGRCAAPGGGTAICTRSCESRPCPRGLVCQTTASAERLCAAPPPSGKLAVGFPCAGSNDCASGECIDVVGDAWGPFCTAPCTHDASCPETMACYLGQTGDARCLYRNNVASVGATCSTDADCASGVCIDVARDTGGPFCTDVCRGDIDCPAAMTCEELTGLGASCIY